MQNIYISDKIYVWPFLLRYKHIFILKIVVIQKN